MIKYGTLFPCICIENGNLIGELQLFQMYGDRCEALHLMCRDCGETWGRILPQGEILSHWVCYRPCVECFVKNDMHGHYLPTFVEGEDQFSTPSREVLERDFLVLAKLFYYA